MNIGPSLVSWVRPDFEEKDGLNAHAGGRSCELYALRVGTFSTGRGGLEL